MDVPKGNARPSPMVVPGPAIQMDPTYVAMAAATMQEMGRLIQPISEKIPELGDMSDEEFISTQKRSVARGGRTDEQILKALPEDEEAFAHGKGSDLIMIRKRKKPDPKLEDLTS